MHTWDEFVSSRRAQWQAQTPSPRTTPVRAAQTPEQRYLNLSRLEF